MPKYQHKLRLALYLAFTVAALVILVDFIAPGTRINDTIISIKKERQQYYNAAQNYHYTYKVITRQHKFLVKEDFVALDLVNKEIQYSVSQIFKEVNWYRLLSSENKSFYSLRVASGLILPLLSIISFLLVYRYNKKINILVLILRILLVADLIFLIT